MTKATERKLLASILSMSLLTVMAGAAIAPALGIIKEHFADSPDILVQFIVSLPALFIIFMNLGFRTITKHLKTRTIALLGLSLYVVSGALPYFMVNLPLILVCRALLGLSVGLIMPLSTGLLSFYFPPEKQAALMGVAAAMNQFGGLVATMLAGMLATISWNSSFLVYLLGVLAIVMILFWLPNESIAARPTKEQEQAQSESMGALLRRFHPSVVGMFLCMTLFFVYPSNFAMITTQSTDFSSNVITGLMVGLEVVATITGMLFGTMMKRFRTRMKFFAPLGFLAGYAVFLIGNSMVCLFVGSVLVGFANGVGVPYLNTIASIKGGRTAATTVMPLISASLYVGQFLSPIIIGGLACLMPSGNPDAPYAVAFVLAVIFLVQTFLTRRFQSLPPK